MGAAEIRQYLSHLATHKQIAASTQNVALNALLFLYHQVLQIELPYIDNKAGCELVDYTPEVREVMEVMEVKKFVSPLQPNC